MSDAKYMQKYKGLCLLVALYSNEYLKCEWLLNQRECGDRGDISDESGTLALPTGHVSCELTLS